MTFSSFQDFPADVVGRSLNAGTVILNYEAKNMAPTQKDQPLPSSKRWPRFQTHERTWNEQKYGHVPRGDPKRRISMLARPSSKLLYCTALTSHRTLMIVSETVFEMPVIFNQLRRLIARQDFINNFGV
jgi:hypothetical protein